MRLKFFADTNQPLKKLIPLFVLLLSAGLTGCGGEQPEPEIVTITDEESEEAALADRESVSVTMAEGFEVYPWASRELLGDPIALDMDDEGRAWITVTNRSNNSEFDIRGVDPGWLQETIKLESVEDRRDFLHRELAPERSEENEQIVPDRNEDGSHDWRDLTVEKEEIYRIEDTSGDGRADQSQLFIRDFHDEVTDVAGAILHHNGEVFLGVGPDMWRIRDTNGDGMADWKESISHGYNVHIGFSGHGMSGATVGPDGRIYWGIGDMGLNVVDQEGNQWYHPNRGAILRSEPDGSNFEVFAYGVRNTHEFVFDKYGNLISVDNDGDHAGEYERLVYLVNGSDSGWRINWQFGKYTDPRNNEYKVWMDEEYYKPRWDDQAAHILPPIAPYHAGPAGMVYNPGTALSEEWKEHFFVMSFRGSPSNSAIYGFTLEESGASFELNTDQEVLSGILAVGLDFSPDGSLYMADWIEGWDRKEEGRIWKMDTPETANSEIRAETQRLIQADFGNESAENLTGMMAHDDMRIRQKAQFELVDRGDSETLLSAVENSDNQLARIHGIWGLAQLGRQESEVVEPLIGLLNDGDSEIRAQAAKMLGDVRYEPAAESLVPLLEDEHARTRFFATEALGRIGHRPALEPIVAMLEANDDEDVYLRHGGAIALERIGDGDAVAELAGHSSRAVRIAAVVALKRLEHPGVAQFLEDEDEFIVTNAARAISDDHFVEDAMPAMAELLSETSFTNEPLIRRAINANLYGGTQADAQRLANFAARSDIGGVLRIEALNTLAVWPEPSIFDRITGRHRGQVENNPDDARQAIEPVLAEILGDESSAVRVAGLEAAGGLEYRGAEEKMIAMLADDRAEEVRIAALNALLDSGYEDAEGIVNIALEDENSSVRMHALSRLTELDLPAGNTVAMLESVLQSGSVTEQQAALEALSGIEDSSAHDVLAGQLELLRDGGLAPEIELDVVLAAETAGSDALRQQLEEYESGKPQDDVLALYREALYGGDAARGRQIFYRDAAAQCVRCHMVDGQGGEVGPDLTYSGDKLTREQILESMVDPSARLEPGYGVVTLTLQNGETVQGMLYDETESHLTVVHNGENREVAKSDIAGQQNSPSGMPPMGETLSRSQLRDLVEFITTLKQGD